MQVALLTVGDELLAGDTANTNATWLAKQLTERGVSVRRVLVVPDVREVIVENVRDYSEAFDAVIVTGGLGGTPDDITMAAVAEAFDRELAVNDLALTDVEAYLESIADDYPDLDVDAEAEATIPAGSRPLLNNAGLAPGCVLENVYVLPGIPQEMKRMFEDIADEFEGDAVSRSWYTTEPEANLIETLSAARERFDVSVGCYPDRDAGHNRLKITGDDPEEVDAAAEWLAEHVDVSVDPPDGSV